MHNILFSFTIDAPPARVFETIAHPAGLNAWWPVASSGHPAVGERYEFDFGPGCRWAAIVTACHAPLQLEWRLTEADEDWTGTVVSFHLAPEGNSTRVEFAHTGWRDAHKHYRVSAFCWAAYLRLLRRYVEDGDIVPYADRKGA